MTEEFLDTSKIDGLLQELSASRNELTNYMREFDDLRQKVSAIFPQTTDFRNKFVLEEKIKAASSFYTTLLNIRQEFNKTIKEEIELRRRISPKQKNDEELDVRSIADQLEQQKKLDSEKVEN